jgi:hypothetical protein
MRILLGVFAAAGLVLALPVHAADAAPPLSVNSLVERIVHGWSPDCGTPGANQARIDIRFTISPNGQVMQGPDWVNQSNDPVWQASADRAKQAILSGQPYSGLPEAVYGKPIVITFDARSACNTLRQ